MLEMAFELRNLNHSVKFRAIFVLLLIWAVFAVFTEYKTAKLRMQCRGSVLKYGTQVKFFWGSQD